MHMKTYEDPRVEPRLSESFDRKPAIEIMDNTQRYA